MNHESQQRYSQPRGPRALLTFQRATQKVPLVPLMTVESGLLSQRPTKPRRLQRKGAECYVLQTLPQPQPLPSLPRPGDLCSPLHPIYLNPRNTHLPKSTRSFRFDGIAKAHPLKKDVSFLLHSVSPLMGRRTPVTLILASIGTALLHPNPALFALVCSKTHML